MPTGHKIALLGMGMIGRVIFSGAAALTLSETKNEKSDFDMLKVITPVDKSILVKAYKKVQRKCYPEKDVYVGNKK